VNPIELKAEERLIWANQVSFDMARRMIKAIEENYGPKGREIATGALYDVGHELGLRFRNLLQIKGTKPLDYATLHRYIDTNLWGIEEEIIQGESGEAIIRASSCPLQSIFQFRDCEAFGPYVRGLADVINPSLNLKARDIPEWPTNRS
jgi:hypothetical protein